MQRSHEKRARLHDEKSLDLLIMVWVYRFALLLMMMAGVCKFGVMPIQLMSGDCLIIMAAYMVLLVILQDIYHACEIGQARVSELIMSQLLAELISTGVLYMCVVLYEHRFFNPVLLLVVLCAQVCVGVVWTILGNGFYFKRYRQPRVAVVYRNEADFEMLCLSPYFHERFNVVKKIHHTEETVGDLRRQLEDCEAVFTLGISAELLNDVAKLCLQMGIKGYFTPRLGHIVMSGAQHRVNFNVPMLRVERAGGHSEYLLMKRLFDIFASAIGIVVTMPVMLVTAVAIRLEDHGPAFYRQTRLTKDGKEFSILKFRSMTVNAEKDGIARLAGQNDSRITKVGNFIRTCRIDELPQLFNILMGDMSIVGPRPERPEIACQYEKELPEFALRLQVKAGLTGLAQVYGKYNTDPYHKLQMDLMYINDMSFLKDLQLILATVKILFVKESTLGIAHGQETAMDSQTQRKDIKSA